MSFHPNDVVRRGRAAVIAVSGATVFLLGHFFSAQVLHNQQWVLQSQTNRLRQIPLAAPRGQILDRHGQPIADNVVGYAIALLPQSEDSLRATLRRLRGTIDLTDRQVSDAVRRYGRDKARPTVILPDASFDVVSVLEEHRLDFPNLIIEASPKRIYPAGAAVGAFAGYIGEVNADELSASGGEYKPGQQIGKQGLEKQYETKLRGREGVRFVEVDARNRPVANGGAIADIPPQPAPALYTNIDLDLQTYIHTLFGDTLTGAAVAMVPQTGEVLALYSAPAIDPNRFVGGVSSAYYDSLRTDSRKPLVNKAIQGLYPPGSTWKLATAVMALEDSVATMRDHMPEPCNGAFFFGNHVYHCWDKNGHGSLSLAGAIAKSCDVYFYQLGLKVGLTRLVAGGLAFGFGKKSGIDLPEEKAPIFPTSVPEYFNEKYGPRNWTSEANSVIMAIGQGDNSQTVINMARFYSALATDGTEAAPTIGRAAPRREKTMHLSAQQMVQLDSALANVVEGGGTAAAAAINGVVMAGKTGTAQVGTYSKLNDAWFVGFAPVDDPKIVVVVMLPDVTFHGSIPALLASKIISRYLHKQTVSAIQTEG